MCVTKKWIELTQKYVAYWLLLYDVCDVWLETWFSSLAIGFMVSISIIWWSCINQEALFEKSMFNVKLNRLYFMSKKKEWVTHFPHGVGWFKELFKA